jgi:hypothetical protein
LQERRAITPYMLSARLLAQILFKLRVLALLCG